MISSHIALCQTAYRSASENEKGSEEGEWNTRVEAEVAAAEATRFAIFGCHGLRVMGCLLLAGGDAGEDGGSKETCGS
jgi:hypothetical protein